LAGDLTVRAVTAPQVAETKPASQDFRTRKTPDAAQKFEAFVLQTFIQDMMPETAESVYGSGVSGDFWKSMMAEKIAEQVAQRGSIGIADFVRAGHTAPVRPGGLSSPNVLSSVSTLNGSVGSVLDEPKVPGE
jgi:Rod binding domain-containing protein